MHTEQFRWIDDNPEKDTGEYCSVCVVEDRIDVATQISDLTIGVVVGSLDSNPAWATVQCLGRAEVYRSNYKPPNWVLLRASTRIGPHGPVDEYFIRS